MIASLADGRLRERGDRLPDPISADRHARIGEMRRQVLRHAATPCTETAIPRLTLSVITQPGSSVATIDTPVACLTLQGEKQLTIGDVDLRHDVDHCFLASLDAPATGRVTGVSSDRPYIGIGLALDRAVLADLIAGAPDNAPCQGRPGGKTCGFALDAVNADLIDAWAGLLALLDRPDDIATLAPLREREILYRLLRGTLGGHLREMAREDSRLARIRRAIAWMRRHYRETLRTATLSEISGMSVATFHRHFRMATAMSPLQFQKALRLQAARRMIASGMEAGTAGFSVGYESASQFSRDYKRCFGLPPKRDSRR